VATHPDFGRQLYLLVQITCLACCEAGAAYVNTRLVPWPGIHRANNRGSALGSIATRQAALALRYSYPFRGQASLAEQMGSTWQQNLEMDGQDAEIVNIRLEKSRQRIYNAL